MKIINYFTFGQTHSHKKGYSLKDYYVKVEGNNYNDCRDKFLKWTESNLETIDKWAFQYEEENFDISYFVKGELIFLQ